MQEKLSEVVLILVGSTLIILVLVGLVVISLFIQQKRKFKHRHELSTLKDAYEKEVLKTQLETQAETFGIVSRELHDNVGTLISIAIVQLHSLQNTLPPKKGEEIRMLLGEAMDTLRDISKSANPDNISRLGFTVAIAKELERIERTKLFKTQLSTSGEEFTIEPQKLIILFRIVQEALNNAIKHSEGDRISVMTAFNGMGMEIHIQDNGKGFNTSAVSTTSGLHHMKKRAKLINAAFSIESGSSGTAVHIQYREPHEIPS